MHLFAQGLPQRLAEAYIDLDNPDTFEEGAQAAQRHHKTDSRSRTFEASPGPHSRAAPAHSAMAIIRAAWEELRPAHICLHLRDWPLDSLDLDALARDSSLELV
jgi:hypothetical protein